MIITPKYFTFMIALFCSTLSPANAQEGVSTNVILDACSSEDEGANAMCFGYITGAIHGMNWASDAAAIQSGVTGGKAMREQANTFLGACSPQAALGNQLYEVALQYMRNNPQRWHEPAVTVIHKALMEAFPCE